MVSAISSDGTPTAISYGLFAFVTFLGALGFGVFAYASRASRVEVARRAGESEDAIQRGLATLRRVRNICSSAVVIAVLGAIWFAFANAKAT